MSEELGKRIKQAAEVLKSFGAKEVYVFGSASQGKMDEHSDIDMAVGGLPPEVFFRAMAEACRVLRRELDLVDLDSESPFTRYLREEGELKSVG